jgi:hypothetical protein
MPVRFLLGVLVETIFAQRSTQDVVRHATWWRKCAAWQAPCGNETDARAPHILNYASAVVTTKELVNAISH